MSRWASEGRGKLAFSDNLSSAMTKKGSEAVDLFPAFAKSGGRAMDLTNRLSPEFDLKRNFLAAAQGF